MAKNLAIVLGNCGTQIGKALANSTKLGDDVLSIYAIDSQTSSVDMDLVKRIKFIPIISDEKTGSGRNRERGAAMYRFHEENGAFEQMYADAEAAKAPVLVITSAAGGTGSGACVPVCQALIQRGVQVIPIIVCPSLEDPEAYHLNASDLMIELQDAGIETYSQFRNPKHDADYTPINNDVVRLVEIILGKRYDKTDKDSIDDSDIDVVLSMPGRFIAIAADGNNVDTLRKELTRKVLNGSQPAWTDEEAKANTFITAYSLTSAYADVDFKDVFADVNSRIHHFYDSYKNICNSDNSGEMNATLSVAGLPRAEMKVVESQFNIAAGIGAGMNKSARPSFLNRKKASTTAGDKGDGSPRKFSWK